MADAERYMPKLLWISIAALGIMMLLNVTGGVVQMKPVIIAVGLIDGLLIWGIVKGFRWAFWITVVLVFGGLCYIMFTGSTGAIVASAILDSFLFVPVLICRKHFFNRTKPSTPI